MTDRKARAMLLSAHYYLMGSKRFWYDRGLLDASRILCVAASDIWRKVKARV